MHGPVGQHLCHDLHEDARSLACQLSTACSGWWYKLRVHLEPDAHVAELVRPRRASETDLFRSIDGGELMGGSGRTEMGVDMLARADNVLARTVVQSVCSAPPKPDAVSNVP
ncbi:hypothetical protein C2845_PM02G20240 [Panicum miliaceum]|uniref:Uncharacterized protein n=1 Tax=Panicum miliaceum TaxID=4540 RepID=A0A3L6S763_PANMI|nr:hypothetical protein C2845_PM02G20240 [Panicum miliaceum]